ncbi:MAG: hypothetical protein JNL52_05200 [Flavobacteriales bacterium]|nr:hypothetical protein [Flavobacteriales bacterium]
MNTAHTLRPARLLLKLVMLFVVLVSLTACQRDEVVAPNTSGNGQVDDHGGHGNGNDDPPGDDNGGDN